MEKDVGLVRMMPTFAGHQIRRLLTLERDTDQVFAGIAVGIVLVERGDFRLGIVLLWNGDSPFDAGVIGLLQLCITSPQKPGMTGVRPENQIPVIVCCYRWIDNFHCPSNLFVAKVVGAALLFVVSMEAAAPRRMRKV